MTSIVTSIKKKLSMQTEKALADEMVGLAFIQNPIAMLILDENGIILKTNFAFHELIGYEEMDLFGKHISLFESDKNETSLYDMCYKNILLAEHSDSCEMYILCKNDLHLLVRKKIKYIVSNEKQYILLTFEDITEEKRVLEYYQHLSTHDPLTGLANRVLLHDNFKKAQHRAIRNNQKMALLVCDINEFKQFNDSHGHDLGDSVLKIVAKTLEKMLRSNDTVARYGGDEFVLILEEISDSDQIMHITNKIKSAFPVSCIGGKEDYKINMSVGCAFFPDEGYSFNQLIEIADQNMYQDKRDFYSAIENERD